MCIRDSFYTFFPSVDVMKSMVADAVTFFNDSVKNKLVFLYIFAYAKKCGFLIILTKYCLLYTSRCV